MDRDGTGHEVMRHRLFQLVFLVSRDSRRRDRCTFSARSARTATFAAENNSNRAMSDCPKKNLRNLENNHNNVKVKPNRFPETNSIAVGCDKNNQENL